MNYQNTLAFLFSSLPVYQRDGKSAYKANLNNTQALDAFLEQPHTGFRTIHVAGTNGKGSVSHMLASVFQQAGYKTGLYTSPHLLDFRERIKVNGQMVSESFVVDFVERIKSQIDLLKPSFFEMTVAMAFDYFKNQKVDIAIVETGLGGRLDSTNILMPIASVITNIGLDHTQFLGNTLQKIAVEKAGIIKNETPVIIGETHPETQKVFKQKAAKNNAPIVFADALSKVKNQFIEGLHQTIEIKRGNFVDQFRIDLLGNYQTRNLVTALETLNLIQPLYPNIQLSLIKLGLQNVVANTGLRGRWEIIKSSPTVVCDSGHNAEGISLITKQLKQTHYKHLHIVLGMVNDKASSEVLKLLPKNASYYFTKATIPRAKNADELRTEAANYNLYGDAYDNVASAYNAALKQADTTDLIFVGGSTFVVADFLAI